MAISWIAGLAGMIPVENLAQEMGSFYRPNRIVFSAERHFGEFGPRVFGAQGQFRLARRVGFSADSQFQVRQWDMLAGISYQRFPLLDAVGQIPLGVRYMALPNSRNGWIGQISLAGNSPLSFSTVWLFPRVSALYLRRSPQNHRTWVFGLAYSYAFGRGIPLPIIGYQKTWKNRLRLSFFLPFRGSLQYQTSRFRMEIMMRPQSMFFASREPFQMESLKGLGYRFFKFGFQGIRKLSNGDHLIFSMGRLVRRQYFAVHHPAQPNLSKENAMSPGAYIEIGYRLHFQKRKKETPMQAKPEIPSLDNLDLNGLTPEDLD